MCQIEKVLQNLENKSCSRNNKLSNPQISNIMKCLFKDKHWTDKCICSAVLAEKLIWRNLICGAEKSEVRLNPGEDKPHWEPSEVFSTAPCPDWGWDPPSPYRFQELSRPLTWGGNRWVLTCMSDTYAKVEPLSPALSDYMRCQSSFIQMVKCPPLSSA